VLVRAAPALLKAHPKAHIVIAGGLPEGSDEGYEEELRQLCEDLDVCDSVHLAGRREDIPQMLAACDVFVLPSRREGFPGAVLEAMATERPVVVTPPASAGVEEGHCGMIVPADDPEALAAAVIELLGDPDRARRMGEAGRRHVLEHFSLEPMVRRYEEVYWELLNGSEG
jgi:glycosyltransferase involved in cell wall biosynthesis